MGQRRTALKAYVVEHAGGPFTETISGIGRARHGEILREVAALADAGRLKPLLNDQRFSPADIAAAHALVESAAVGKVVVEF